MFERQAADVKVDRNIDNGNVEVETDAQITSRSVVAHIGAMAARR